jgi:hypothetical protein
MTGGILESKDLVTDQTTISVSAGGNAEIYATVLVDAKESRRLCICLW